jgi:predicted nucleic-acid-binding protein
MHAVDTNVIVRFLTRDHAEQYARARALISSEQIFVSMTVLLETEWVLRSAYRFPPAAIAKALIDFAGLPTVTIQHPAHLKNALELVLRDGVDMEDAFHIASADGCDAFMSFDRELAKRAGRASSIPVRVP